jgi:hypothetical protein
LYAQHKTHPHPQLPTFPWYRRNNTTVIEDKGMSSQKKHIFQSKVSV